MKAGNVVIQNHPGSMSETALDNPALYMTDLDEALFPIPQLVNFSASLVTPQSNASHAKDRAKVKLSVLPNRTGGIANQTLLALQTLIQVIRIARQTGLLDIQIQVQEFDIASAGSLAKRVITDRRQRKPCQKSDLKSGASGRPKSRLPWLQTSRAMIGHCARGYTRWKLPLTTSIPLFSLHVIFIT